MVLASQLKGELIRKTAEQLHQPPQTVEDVVAWMFRDVLKHVRVVGEIELSGFGSLILSAPKMRRRVVQLLRIKTALEKRPLTEDVERKLTITNNYLEFFYEKLGMEKNMGGLSQSTGSPKENERADSEDSHGEVGNMQELPKEF